VRLRRTIAVALGLVLLTTTGVRVLTRHSVENVVEALPKITPTTTRPSADSSSGRSEDGSAAPETRAADAASVPQRGNGKITVVSVPPATPAATGRTVKYTVEIEGGLDVDAHEVASTVQSVLLDSRGWQKVDGVRFVNVTPAQSARGDHVDIRVTLASPGLTDKLCLPMQTLSQVSCWNGTRSVLNYRRWALGDDSYGSDVARYRVYQVNHEVGHGLGHQHRQCPGKGTRAPVMVQQTLDLGGCKPWPFPSGA
jgi:hypothetical protein